MPCSPEKLASNRKNSLKSTGPSPQGKLISRKNGLKHGLTGAGIVIPDEDLAAVEERIEAFRADLKPRNDVAQFLATRAAVLSVRLDRCVRQEAAKITSDMMEADAIEVEARANDLAYDISLLEDEPAKAVRNLLRSPEGIDWLIQAWRFLLVALFDAEWPRFSFGRAQRLSGGPLTGFRESRMAALALAIGDGLRDPVTRKDPVPLEPARLEAVRGELKPLVEAEIARLEGVKARLDHEAIAKDRAGARARSIFDPSKEATLARKYEAAAEREFHRALKAIERINAEADEADEVVANGESTEDCADLASSSPDDEGGLPGAIVRRSRGPSTAPGRPTSERSGRDDVAKEVSGDETAGSIRRN